MIVCLLVHLSLAGERKRRITIMFSSWYWKLVCRYRLHPVSFNSYQVKRFSLLYVTFFRISAIWKIWKLVQLVEAMARNVKGRVRCHWKDNCTYFLALKFIHAKLEIRLRSTNVERNRSRSLSGIIKFSGYPLRSLSLVNFHFPLVFFL